MKSVHLCSTLAILVVFACSAGGDGDSRISDAGVSFEIDSQPIGDQDGVPCMRATEEDLRGTCAEGYVCVKRFGDPAQCRQECPTRQQLCEGYEGPGSSFCAEYILDGNNQILGNYCIIACGDESGTFPGCQDGACNGECPGAMSCEDNFNNPGLKTCEPCTYNDCDI